jgi:protein-disulfide isomerase
MRNINMNDVDRWPIRQIVLGIVLFASGVAVGYTARDWPSWTAGTGSASASASARDDPAWGPADAKVTMVEFADFECTFCRQWYATVYSRLVQNYGDKVRFIYRDFPLTTLHYNALGAANAANCANAQGRYWDYFNLLFSDPRGLGDSQYITYAREIGLDMNSFSKCVTANTYLNEINLDLQDGESLGVNGVPAFFINNRMISGLQPYETFQQAIEAELNK